MATNPRSPTRTTLDDGSERKHMHHRRGGGGTSNSRATNGGSNPQYGGYYGSGNDMYGGGRGRPNGGTGGGGMSANETNRNIMEQQNNERINELSDSVARLKGLTIDIGNEVREQNSLLDNMEDGFASTRDMLKGSLSRIGTMLERGGAKHMCYMVGFVVFVMVFLYWVISYKGTSGA